jgi:hypothetical protein
VGNSVPYYITASANVGGVAGGMIYGVTITAGADAALVTLKEEGSGGSIILRLAAPILTTTVWHPAVPVAYSGQLYALITGTTPGVTVEL